MLDMIDPLLLGRQVESEIFGYPMRIQEPVWVRPEQLPLDRSIQQQIKVNWKNYANAIEVSSSYQHNPYDPQMGQTRMIWKSVKRAIERKWKTKDYWPVLLYVARGRSSLDYWYGVDAFFWWNGVHVTIDLSTKHKLNKRAEFLLTPNQVVKEHLSYFGQQVANLLVQKRLVQNRKDRWKSG